MANSAPLPCISVFIPVYSGAATSGRAIRSVCSQMFQHWKIVAVDDGTADASFARLERWATEDDRIRAVRLDANREVTRNVANQSSQQARL
jgi:glycosyltransferase involved in cell wall biosynthesis